MKEQTWRKQMKTKKKLSYSSIPVDDITITKITKRYSEETGIQPEYITKRSIVNMILANYANGKLKEN
jgi:hypothetical protein